MTPFQCDKCQFVNMQKRLPVDGQPKDSMLLMCIRRANLDAFWAREPKTVAGNLTEARAGLRNALALGITQPFPSMGPLPLEDKCGMTSAVLILMRSLDPGMNAPTVQFDTIRKSRSMYSNVFHAGLGSCGASVMAKDKYKTYVTSCPTYSFWYERFMLGAQKRMGRISKPDLGISIKVMHALLEDLEKDRLDPCISAQERERIDLVGAWFVIAFVGALRGEEVPMVDLFGLRQFFDEGANHEIPHVVVTLLGKLKGEAGTDYHMLPMAAITKTGIPVQRWILRAIQSQARFAQGPLFRNSSNEPAKMSQFEEEFHARLRRIQLERGSLIPDSVDVEEEYGLKRSFRRGSNTHAGNQGVNADVVDKNNRWRTVENCKTGKPNFNMQQHYTEISQALVALLEYSLAL